MKSAVLSMSRRGKVIIGVVLAVVGIVLLSSLFLFRNVASITPACEADFAANTPDAFKMLDSEELDTEYLIDTYSDVTLKSRDQKADISAWYIPTKEPSDKVVIAVHGIQTCKRNPAVLRIASMLKDSGINTLLIDLREHGDSSVLDGLTTAGVDEYNDVLGAYDWLTVEQGFDPQSIGIAGGSLGAGVSLRAFAQEQQLKALWVDSIFYNTREISQKRSPFKLSLFVHMAWLGGKITTGVNLYEASPDRMIRDSNGRSVFFVHTKNDDVIPSMDSHQLFADAQRYTEDAQLWISDGDGHVTSVFNHPEEYRQRLKDFFLQRL